MPVTGGCVYVVEARRLWWRRRAGWPRGRRVVKVGVTRHLDPSPRLSQLRAEAPRGVELRLLGSAPADERIERGWHGALAGESCAEWARRAGLPGWTEWFALDARGVATLLFGLGEHRRLARRRDHHRGRRQRHRHPVA